MSHDNSGNRPPAPGAPFPPTVGMPQSPFAPPATTPTAWSPPPGPPTSSPFGAPPASSPFGAPPAWPASAPPASPFPPPVASQPFGPPSAAWGSAPGALAGAVPTGYGDRAREHLTMSHGRWSAWLYVGIAFIMEAALFAALVVVPTLAITEGEIDDGETVTLVALVGGAAVGLLGAFFVFRDRWRCVETFASRFCAGIANISILYVPLIALGYANVRGVRKLFGR